MFQLPPLQLLETLFCFSPDWNFLFPYLYLSSLLCSRHWGWGSDEKMPFGGLSPKALPAAETCRGYIRWVSNLAQEACRRFNACKCPWPLAPVLSDSPLQVLQMRGWFKIRLCFASHWPVKPGKNSSLPTKKTKLQWLIWKGYSFHSVAVCSQRWTEAKQIFLAAAAAAAYFQYILKAHKSGLEPRPPTALRLSVCELGEGTFQRDNIKYLWVPHQHRCYVRSMRLMHNWIPMKTIISQTFHSQDQV